MGKQNANEKVGDGTHAVVKWNRNLVNKRKNNKRANKREKIKINEISNSQN